MANFFGEYTVLLDDKGRLVLPSKFREEDAAFVIEKGLEEPFLEMYTKKEWEQHAEEKKKEFDFYDAEDRKLWRSYMNNCIDVTPDEKTGRIVIPLRLLNKIGVKKEVIFAGQYRNIEIWAKEVWENMGMLDDKDYDAAMKKKLGRKKNNTSFNT
jgi:MraZ protein